MPVAVTIQSCLSAHQVDFELVQHPKTLSSRESAESAHVAADHVAKAVLVRDANGFAMAVIPGSGWLKLSALREASGREFDLADESDVDRLFSDCQPGAIPPLGPAYGLETYLDMRLTTLANVYFEAGDHEHLVHIHGEAFHDLLKGARHGHFSHDD